MGAGFSLAHAATASLLAVVTVLTILETESEFFQPVPLVVDLCPMIEQCFEQATTYYVLPLECSTAAEVLVTMLLILLIVLQP